MVGGRIKGGTGLGREAADSLAAIVEASDDAIYSKNPEAIITSWNASAERLYGYASDEVLGKSVAIIVPRDRKGEELHILDRILRGERVSHYETKRLRKDGTIVEVSVSVSPVRNARGEIVEAAIIARDISERTRLQMELDATRQAQVAKRRKQALELNDEVVQGLAVAKMALESKRPEQGLEAVAITLKRAQEIVSRLLDEHRENRDLGAGDLVRDQPGDLDGTS